MLGWAAEGSQETHIDPRSHGSRDSHPNRSLFDHASSSLSPAETPISTHPPLRLYRTFLRKTVIPHMSPSQVKLPGSIQVPHCVRECARDGVDSNGNRICVRYEQVQRFRSESARGEGILRPLS
jgi:hypothetical protein